MDIKHINSNKHKEFTGVPNELILENARKIAESGTRLIIRVPVIPGFNDTIEEIKAIATFAKTLPNVTELHLLPYHRLGQDKYDGLNRNYSLTNIGPLSNERMEELLTVVKLSGLESQIGG
jgi:pyruvate formate lyase activating enzyme